jgi:DNA-binding transcriptional MerR regulator
MLVKSLGFSIHERKDSLTLQMSSQHRADLLNLITEQLQRFRNERHRLPPEQNEQVDEIIETLSKALNEILSELDA